MVSGIVVVIVECVVIEMVWMINFLLWVCWYGVIVCEF